MRIYLLVFCILLFNVLNAQKHDFQWLMGYSGDGGQEEWGITVLDFNDDPLAVYKNESFINMDGFNVSVADISGQLLFYSNGVDIFNASHDTLSGSPGFNYYEYHENNYPGSGLPIVQGGISIPSVADPDLHYLFHMKIDLHYADISEYFYYCTGLFYTSIDMTGDDGQGEVVEFGIPIIEDSLARTGLTATRHANGRDWWILIPDARKNTFHRILLDSEGLQVMELQELASETLIGFGQATFSPDGTWYIRNNMLGVPDGGKDYIDVYRFDRCTGLLSEHQRFVYADGPNVGGGTVVSPNNRYLYIGHGLYVYQYDLWADDIAASKDTIAEWDGVTDGPFVTSFFMGANAPDGKIYMSATSTIVFLHQINNPNGGGLNSQLIQRGLDLPTHQSLGLPNFPNFRLGPIDGSPCDTLGINNHPIAAFNYYPDTLDNLTINFWDYSYYEPTNWLWNFGDGNTASGQTPTHSYAESGIYEVCLTAWNEYGTDVICKTLEFTLTNIREIEKNEYEVYAFPNPSRGNLTFSFSSTAEATIQIHNTLGQQMKAIHKEQGLSKVTCTVRDLPSGVYFYSIISANEQMTSGSFVVEK